MKNKLSAFLIGVIPISTIAGMDYNDALNSHNQEFRHLELGVSNTESYDSFTKNTETPYNSVSVKVSSATYYLRPPIGSSQTKTLAKTSTHTCALSKAGGYYGRGLKGFDAKVYKSGSYWKLTVGRNNCGGCDTWGEAICWTIQ